MRGRRTARIARYKGDASYYCVARPARANAVWSYEQPIAAVAAIKELLAFYPDKVEIADNPSDLDLRA